MVVNILTADMILPISSLPNHAITDYWLTAILNVHRSSFCALYQMKYRPTWQYFRKKYLIKKY